MSFALLSLTFICGLTALISRLFGADDEALMALRRLSLLFLYPALTTLGIGILSVRYGPTFLGGNIGVGIPKKCGHSLRL